MMDWEVKSQQAFIVFWTTTMRLIIGTKSIWSWSDSLERDCTTDNKNDIFTDRIVTYWKYQV